ncbi:MAG: LPS translocon maturation chaperone LptM [Rhodospirillales bacterium]
MALRRGIFGFIALGVFCAALTACGRKGAPEFPEGSQFPKPYPQQEKLQP